jgi:hypothetical protein
VPNRRGFLKTLLGLPGLGFFPWAKEAQAFEINHNWYAILHPETEANFVGIHARAEWERRWHQYRIERRFGKPELTPKQIMENYEPFTIISPEIGRYENVRFITSDSIL